jgi:hypothetical protein
LPLVRESPTELNGPLELAIPHSEAGAEGQDLVVGAPHPRAHMAFWPYERLNEEPSKTGQMV